MRVRGAHYPEQVEDLDRRIVDLLAKDGRISFTDLGKALGMSTSAVHQRVRRLEQRGGGMGLISGRKAFQKPFKEGVELLQAVQDVYLSKDVTVA